MNALSDDVKKARAMGLSYGEFKALTYRSCPAATSTPKPSKKKPRKCDITAIFPLWQQGYSDAQIAQQLGTSRAYIQKYRDTYELPSNKTVTDTHKYYLVETSYGIFVMKK